MKGPRNTLCTVLLEHLLPGQWGTKDKELQTKGLCVGPRPHLPRVLLLTRSLRPSELRQELPRICHLCSPSIPSLGALPWAPPWSSQSQGDSHTRLDGQPPVPRPSAPTASASPSAQPPGPSDHPNALSPRSRPRLPCCAVLPAALPCGLLGPCIREGHLTSTVQRKLPSCSSHLAKPSFPTWGATSHRDQVATSLKGLDTARLASPLHLCFTSPCLLTPHPDCLNPPPARAPTPPLAAGSLLYFPPNGGPVGSPRTARCHQTLSSSGQHSACPVPSGLCGATQANSPPHFWSQAL